jgi:hypothetical protein
MKCKQIQSSFYDYVDDTLEQSIRSVIENHLSGCVACRRHYETQRSLHQGVTNAVAGELANLHFQPRSISAEPTRRDRRPSFNAWARQMAYAVPALLLLGIILVPIRKPAPKRSDDLSQSPYAETYDYLERCSTNRVGLSSLTMPVAVIIQPGVPDRVIELDGTTDISAEIK